MRVLTAGEIADWFQWSKKLGDEYVHYDSSGPFFASAEAACIDLEYPSKLERLPSSHDVLRQSGMKTNTSKARWFGSPDGQCGT